MNDANDEAMAASLFKHKLSGDETVIKYSFPREPSVSIPCEKNRLDRNMFNKGSFLKHKLQSRTKKPPEQRHSDPIQFEFIDVDDTSRAPLAKIDIDNVILSEGQKKLLFWQCIRSKQFWVLYAMQGLSILFAYYVVNVYKLFGEGVPELDNDEYLTLVNSISAIFNALRFVWSGAIDKLPFRYIYGALLLM